MEALRKPHGAWVEDEERVQATVDPRTLLAVLQELPASTEERRGSARTLRFRASYDRDGRYAVDAVLYQSAQGIVAVVQDDVFRSGDVFYVVMSSRVARFVVLEIRAGSRPQDTHDTHVLYLHLE